MKTWYFEFSSGWIGGSGVVIAKTIGEAVNMADEAIAAEPMNTQKTLLTEADLKEIPKGTCVITSSGNY